MINGYSEIYLFSCSVIVCCARCYKSESQIRKIYYQHFGANFLRVCYTGKVELYLSCNELNVALINRFLNTMIGTHVRKVFEKFIVERVIAT